MNNCKDIQFEINNIAREYAEEEYKTLNLPTDHTEVSAYRYMDFARFLLRRFCLVEKSKLEELKIAHRAKEHGAVWLNPKEVEYLFPKITEEV